MTCAQCENENSLPQGSIVKLVYCVVQQKYEESHKVGDFYVQKIRAETTDLRKISLSVLFYVWRPKN